MSGKHVRIKPVLTLADVTINAMALIAPGAFLWLTFQMQAAQNINGKTTAADMVPGLLTALALAFLTAYSYSQLANLFPNAGAGSSYYFAEAALLKRKAGGQYKFARLAKFIVGWVSHLYYWVYPGLIVGTFAVLTQYIAAHILGLAFAASNWFAYATAIFTAITTGTIAYRGIKGSTAISFIINIIQIVSLVILGLLAILYRIEHPHNTYTFPSAASIVIPHSFSGVIFQAAIAILLLVGFESITALSAETQKAKKNIPAGILLSLAIQGLIMYLFEYFAANYFMGTQYTGPNATKGLAAAAYSSAPIGDMAVIIGNWLGGFGKLFAVCIALTVMIALIGTTLACLNTGVRITNAMGRDNELPELFGAIHHKSLAPHLGIIVLTVVSAVIGVYCSAGFTIGGVTFSEADTLSQITYTTNIGTFLLYGMTCLITLLAFHAKMKDFHIIKHRVIPALGLIANIGLLIGIFALAAISGGAAALDAKIAIGAAIVFALFGAGLFFIRSRIFNIAIFYQPKPEAFHGKVRAKAQPEM